MEEMKGEVQRLRKEAASSRRHRQGFKQRRLEAEVWMQGCKRLMFTTFILTQIPGEEGLC